MKKIINISAILILLSIFTSTIFAQENNVQVRKMVKAQTLQGVGNQGPNYVDADGDGICDNAGTENQGTGNGYQRGLKDGTHNRVMPQDGTGFGKGSGSANGDGTGTCDGSGVQGASKRKGGN